MWRRARHRRERAWRARRAFAVGQACCLLDFGLAEADAAPPRATARPRIAVRIRAVRRATSRVLGRDPRFLMSEIGPDECPTDELDGWASPGSASRLDGPDTGSSEASTDYPRMGDRRMVRRGARAPSVRSEPDHRRSTQAAATDPHQGDSALCRPLPRRPRESELQRSGANRAAQYVAEASRRAKDLSADHERCATLRA